MIYLVAICIFINLVTLICLLRTEEKIMTAIENLNQSVTDLQAEVATLVVPVSNDVAIQAAADNINKAVADLKAKVV